jgi:uncharacterized protein (TIGR00156 family)
LALLFSAAAAQAQQGGFSGPTQSGTTGQQGFTGPVMITTVAEAQKLRDDAKTFLRGNVVSHLGGDRYMFRDETGEFVVKIKPNRWIGISAGPSDLVEIYGEVERNLFRFEYFDVKSIRRI